jgi:nickel-dependent lactate racemase
MRSELERTIRTADLTGWMPVRVEYGERDFEVRVPPECRILAMPEAAPAPEPREAVRRALGQPIGTPPLAEILRAKGRPAGDLRVCITTSDITRPVPYKGESGILAPLLQALRECGVARERVTLLVGTGTHRASTPAEKRAMFGDEVPDRYRIVDHDCSDAARLVDIGTTASGTAIRINRTFVEADVRIATALVESHFMAGASGGRKAVCPALVSQQTIERFHSAAFLDSPRATNLVLEGNPCHEEALEIARMAGVDFIVNTVLNRRLELVQVFAGDLVLAHEQAVALLRRLVAIPVEEECDIVLTHGGYVGINHYQVAKAAVNALPAVKSGGTLILAACERDEDPIGPAEYRTLLHLLALQGHERYLATLKSPAWRFTKDQWEPQMWGKVLAKVGEAGLVYCSARLPRTARGSVPGGMGWEYLPDGPPADEVAQVRAMVQNALIAAVQDPRFAGRRPATAFIPEGPYAVPMRAQV